MPETTVVSPLSPGAGRSIDLYLYAHASGNFFGYVRPAGTGINVGEASAGVNPITIGTARRSGRPCLTYVPTAGAWVVRWLATTVSPGLEPSPYTDDSNAVSFSMLMAFDIAAANNNDFGMQMMWPDSDMTVARMRDAAQRGIGISVSNVGQAKLYARNAAGVLTDFAFPVADVSVLHKYEIRILPPTKLVGAKLVALLDDIVVTPVIDASAAGGIVAPVGAYSGGDQGGRILCGAAVSLNTAVKIYLAGGRVVAGPSVLALP